MEPDLRVVERSPVAFVAKIVLRTRAVAVTLGTTIHLSGATRGEFLASPLWVEHERVHVGQYRRHGFWRFLALYLAESVRRGYHDNRFEVEARERAAEVVRSSRTRATGR